MGDRADENLMLAVGCGDLDAFEEIVLRYQTKAWRVAFRITGDAAEAEDLAQEAFLRVLDAAPRYEPTASFRTFLFRILERLCIDHLRKRSPSLTEDPPPQADDAAPAARRLSDQERDTAIQGALDALPSGQRLAVTLRYFGGLSGSEIAEAMDVSVKAVEGLLARGRDRLQVLLGRLMEDR